MRWEKKICIRLTTRRIFGAILVASTVVNVVIVGAMFNATSSSPAPAMTSVEMSHLSTSTSGTSGENFTPTQTSDGTATIVTPSQIVTTIQTSTDVPHMWILCIKKFYWQTYLVQWGQSLALLAPATGSTVNELMAANCLSNDQVYTGQLLYVPRLPGKPATSTFSPTPTNTTTNTPFNTPTNTATNTPTITPTTTSTATDTPSPTATNTSSPIATDTPTDTPPSSADLVVTVLRVTGSANIVANGEEIEVPIYVVVQNQGGMSDGVFKLSAHYTGRTGKFLVAFTVPNQESDLFPFNSVPLANGQQVAFAGIIKLPGTLQGTAIELSVLADSCIGDELLPGHCRVFESNEENNESQPTTIKLPSNNAPVASITTPDTDIVGPFDNDLQYDNLWSGVVKLSGSAIDPEDGVLPESSLVWSTDRTDIFIYTDNPVLGTGANISPKLYVYDNDCRGHIITLTATDSDGNVVTATRVIRSACIN